MITTSTGFEFSGDFTTLSTTYDSVGSSFSNLIVGNIKYIFIFLVVAIIFRLIINSLFNPLKTK